MRVKVPKSWSYNRVEKEIKEMQKKGYKNVHLKRHGQLYIQADKR